MSWKFPKRGLHGVEDDVEGVFPVFGLELRGVACTGDEDGLCATTLCKAFDGAKGHERVFFHADDHQGAQRVSGAIGEQDLILIEGRQGPSPGARASRGAAIDVW